MVIVFVSCLSYGLLLGKIVVFLGGELCEFVAVFFGDVGKSKSVWIPTKISAHASIACADMVFGLWQE